MPELPKPHQRPYLTGALEANCRIYERMIVVATRNHDLKVHLQRTYGGTVTPTRWQLETRGERRRLLEGWLATTPYPATENRILRALMHMDGRDPNPVSDI